MPGREFDAGSGYRYGFNGKENDKDISEGGQDYGMRIYDARLGKFLSVDPIANSYPWYTPYQFAGNDVMRCVDLDGLEPSMRTEKYTENHRPYTDGTWVSEVYDKTLHEMFSATGIYDPNTGKTYIYTSDGLGQHGQQRYFYLVGSNGEATDQIKWTLINGRNVLQLINPFSFICN